MIFSDENLTQKSVSCSLWKFNQFLCEQSVERNTVHRPWPPRIVAENCTWVKSICMNKTLVASIAEKTHGFTDSLTHFWGWSYTDCHLLLHFVPRSTDQTTFSPEALYCLQLTDDLHLVSNIDILLARPGCIYHTYRHSPCKWIFAAA